MIIPLASDWTWRDAPRAALFLIITLVLSFVLTQRHDTQQWNAVLAAYQHSVLPALEFPVFVSHLHQSGHGELADRLELAWQRGDRQQVHEALLSDLSFTAAISHKTRDFWGGKDYAGWREARDSINAVLPTISWIRYALVPAENRPITYFTHAFLHQDAVQLVLYLVVILLAGLLLEARIGAFFFLATFLLSSGVAGGCLALSQATSYAPITGATAGCFGLLGMLLVQFRLTKIRFVYLWPMAVKQAYWPALVVAPVWLVVEGVNAWRQFPDYHNGWLAAFALAWGALSMAVMTRWLLTEQTLSHARSDADSDAPVDAFRAPLSRALQALEDFNFAAARDQLRALHSQFPDQLDIVEFRFHLEDLARNHADCDALAEQTFASLTGRVASPAQLDTGFRLFVKYLQRHTLADLPEEQRIALLQGWIRLGELKAATSMAKQISEQGCQHPLFDKTIETLANAWRSAGDQEAAQRCLRWRRG